MLLHRLIETSIRFQSHFGSDSSMAQRLSALSQLKSCRRGISGTVTGISSFSFPDHRKRAFYSQQISATITAMARVPPKALQAITGLTVALRSSFFFSSRTSVPSLIFPPLSFSRGTGPAEFWVFLHSHFTTLFQTLQDFFRANCRFFRFRLWFLAVERWPQQNYICISDICQYLYYRFCIISTR